MSKIGWIILLAVVWVITCSWWYACGVKGLCSDSQLSEVSDISALEWEAIELPVDLAIVDGADAGESRDLSANSDVETVFRDSPDSPNSEEIETDSDIESVKQVDQEAQEIDEAQESQDESQDKNAVRRVVTCNAYINNSLVLGGDNDARDARRLAEFLNGYEGESLEIDEQFTQADALAVKKYQSKYTNSAYAPYGKLQETGDVMDATRNQINVQHCLETNN